MNTYPAIRAISVSTYLAAALAITARNARNDYNALTNIPDWCRDLMRAAEQAGAWKTGIESDRKQRGSAINCDLYGYEADQGLAVVQVREAQFRPGRFTQVRKDYYLIGTTEAGGFFAHPIESPARSKKALETPESCVRYVLARIWNCREQDLGEIERQGDVAFVPVTRVPATAAPIVTGEAVVIRDTHRLTGDLWRDADGTLYARRGARLVHTKRQHAPVKAKAGVYRVQAGVRAATWGFTAPHGD